MTNISPIINQFDKINFLIDSLSSKLVYDDNLKLYHPYRSILEKLLGLFQLLNDINIINLNKYITFDRYYIR